MEIFWDFLGGFLLSGKVIFTTDKPDCGMAILTESFEEVFEVSLDGVDEPERMERWESSEA